MIIQTSGGQVRGYFDHSLYTFKGIPYGHAKRFCPAVPAHWDGVLDCASYGKKAMQPLPAPDGGPVPDPDDYSEDCLYLNVYTPDVHKKLPVVIHIHGGGFQTGSGPDQDGAQIIGSHQFVYVSFNYRLGVFGYLYLGSLLGSKYAQSGNLGTLDQLQAIAWVYENIRAFGGDPEQITVFGESAGAKSIAALMFSPVFCRCCRRVMMASGAIQSIRSTATADAVARRLIAIGHFDRPEALLELSSKELLALQEKLCDNSGNTCTFGPTADGIVIPKDWQTVMHTADFWHGDAIIGCCRHELADYARDTKDFVNAAPEIAKNLFEDYAEYAYQTIEHLKQLHPDQINQAHLSHWWVQVLSDYMYRTHTGRLAQLLEEHGCRVWKYSTEFGRAVHCLDQCLAFGSLDDCQPALLGTSDQDQKALAKAINEYYIRFFETGDPNKEGCLHWPLWHHHNPKVMVWDWPYHTANEAKDDALDDFPVSVYQISSDQDAHLQ